MTFLEIRQRIAEIMGIDSADATADSNATIATKLKEWVNLRYRALASSRSWNWTVKNAVIQTVTEITTGTLTVTAASANITFSTGPTPSVATYDIQIQGSDDWYPMSTHVAGATAGVMAYPYLGTSASGLTFKLRKTYYALPSDMSKILNLKQTRDDLALRYLPARLVDRLVPDRTRVGNPEYYTISGIDSSRQYKVEFYPIPVAAMNISCRYYQVVPEMSADGDFPLIPEGFHDFLVWDTLATYGFMFLDDSRVSAARAMANDLLRDMKKNDVATEDIPVRQEFDIENDNISQQLRQNTLPIR